MSQAVDAMSEERERQQAQLEQVEAENCSLQQTKQQLQEEIDSLLQRITVLSDEQVGPMSIRGTSPVPNVETPGKYVISDHSGIKHDSQMRSL